MARGTRRPGRPRGTQEDPALRRDRLLAAAEAAIRAHGPDVSMDQVAHHANVSRATLYDNFDSRAALTLEIIARYGDPLLADLLDRLGSARTPEAIVRIGLHTYVGHIEADPDIYQFVVRNIGDDVLFRGIAAQLKGLIAVSLSEAPLAAAEDLAYAALGAIVSATERWSERRTPPRLEFERALGDFIWGGLVAGGMTPTAAPIDLTPLAASLAEPPGGTTGNPSRSRT